jgi:hypothetical protein
MVHLQGGGIRAEVDHKSDSAAFIQNSGGMDTIFVLRSTHADPDYRRRPQDVDRPARRPGKAGASHCASLIRHRRAASKGVIDAFEQTDLNHYVSRGTISTGTNARTAKLAPQLNRVFVAVPQAGQQAARILVYEPVNTPEPKLPPTDIKKPVNAPAAEKIVLEMLSAYPLLRRMGLHVVPPSQENMILIANGNATRIGIRTSASDFAAVKNVGIYGPRIEDGEFYNMKIPCSMGKAEVSESWRWRSRLHRRSERTGRRSQSGSHTRRSLEEDSQSRLPLRHT